MEGCGGTQWERLAVALAGEGGGWGGGRDGWGGGGDTAAGLAGRVGGVKRGV